MNDIFLRVIAEQYKRWKQRGYDWKLGVEVEFIPFLPSEFPADNTALKINPENAPFYTLRDHFRLAAIDPKESARKAYHQVRERISDDDDLVRELAAKSFFNSRVELLYELEKLERRMHSENPDEASRAVLNGFLAKMNILSVREGGLRGLIQPRFGDFGLGKGWWDDADMSEVRTDVTSDPFLAIKKYHWILERLMQAGKEFGVIPSNRPFDRHLHFSIWNGDQNMMVDDNVNSEGFKEQALLGLLTRFRADHNLELDVDPTSMTNFSEVAIGSDKGASLRTARNSWEYRPYYTNRWPHLAKDIMLIMLGTAEGVFNEAYRDPASQTPLIGLMKKELDPYHSFRIIRDEQGSDLGISKILLDGDLYENGIRPPFLTHQDDEYPELESLLNRIAKEKGFIGWSAEDYDPERKVYCLEESSFFREARYSTKTAREVFEQREEGANITVLETISWKAVYDIVRLDTDQGILVLDKDWDCPELRSAINGIVIEKPMSFSADDLNVQGLGALNAKINFLESSLDAEVYTDGDRHRLDTFYREHYDSLARLTADRIADAFIADAAACQNSDVEQAATDIVFRNFLIPLMMQTEWDSSFSGDNDASLDFYEPRIKEILASKIARMREEGTAGNFQIAVLEQIQADLHRDRFIDFNRYFELFIRTAFEKIKNRNKNKGSVRVNVGEEFECEEVADDFEGIQAGVLIGLFHELTCHFDDMQQTCLEDDILAYNKMANQLADARAILKKVLDDLKESEPPFDYKEPILEKIEEAFGDILSKFEDYVCDHYNDNVADNVADKKPIKRAVPLEILTL
ncbi:MAG: hypothetical protein AAF549_07710 [Pseudomonadota bacterium]